MMATAKKRKKIRKRRRWEGWERHKILYICIMVSALLHLFVFVSISPWWLGRGPRVKPREVKVVSLKIKPRPAPRPPVKAPPKPEIVRPPEKVPTPPPKPIYTEKQLKESLAQVRSEEIPRKFAKPKATRARDVIKRKEKEAQVWAKKEVDDLDERIEREAAGEVGYSRIIDLQESSDYQVGRLMDHFNMSIDYGRRKITDLNVQFTSEWLFTPGQVRNYLSRHRRVNYREIIAEISGGPTVVALWESGEGSRRPYISPTVDAMAAVLVAEEEYFAETGADPDDMERLVFGPVWTYRGPALKVVKAERKEDAEDTVKNE